MTVNKTRIENNFPYKEYKCLYDKYWKYEASSFFPVSEQVELNILDQFF